MRLPKVLTNRRCRSLKSRLKELKAQAKVPMLIDCGCVGWFSKMEIEHFLT